MNMRAFGSWLLGDELSSVVFKTWKWLWDLPLADPEPMVNPLNWENVRIADRSAIEGARASLRLMEIRVQELAKTATQLSEISTKIQGEYDTYDRRSKFLEQQALNYQTAGNPVPARLAMAEAIAIEQSLPEMLQRVGLASERAQSVQIILMKKRQILATCQMEIDNLQGMAMMNKTLAQTDGFDRIATIDNIAQNFKSAQVEIEDRYHEIHALADLNLAMDLDPDLNTAHLDDLIAQKLSNRDP
jgi:phage shock protein A